MSSLTSFEFFAANAPDEIPDWFVHTPPDIKIPPVPYWDTLPQHLQQQAKFFLDEGEFFTDDDHAEAWERLSDADHTRLEAFAGAVRLSRDTRKRFNYENSVARYFQWRVFFAEKLFAATEGARS